MLLCKCVCVYKVIQLDILEVNIVMNMFDMNIWNECEMKCRHSKLALIIQKTCKVFKSFKTSF